MKRMFLKGLLGLVLLSSVSTGLFFVSEIKVSAVSEDTQNAIDRTEEEKEQLEENLLDQEKEKEQLESQKGSTEERLESLQSQSMEITRNLEEMQKQMADKETEIKRKEAELQVMIEKHEEQYQAMKLRIRYAYETPKDTFFTLFLQNLPFSKILNRMDSVLHMQQYDRKQLEAYGAATEKISAQKTELENARLELQSMIENARIMQMRIDALQQQTWENIQSYLAQISSAQEDIENTEAALKEKSDTLKELYAKAQAEEEAERKRQATDAASKLQDAMSHGGIRPEESGIVYGELNFSQNEMDMLTAMIYCESRGEPYEGQLAVGHVIVNRVRSSKFPNDLESVLRHGKQFEPAGSGRFDIVLTAYWQNIPGVLGQAEWESCRKAAYACVNGESNVGESLFFRTHAPVPKLAENLAAAGMPYWVIGGHIFYYSWMNY